jgi:hypothetical protein
MRVGVGMEGEMREGAREGEMRVRVGIEGEMREGVREGEMTKKEGVTEGEILTDRRIRGIIAAGTVGERSLIGGIITMWVIITISQRIMLDV